MLPLTSDDRLSRANLSGKTIPQHRALRHFEFPKRRWLSVLLIPLGFNIVLWLLRHPVAELWRAIVAFWMGALGLPGSVQSTDVVWRALALPVPSISLAASPPSNTAWWIGLALAILIWPITKFFPERWTPLKYVLRWGSLIQFTAQIYFFFWRNGFPHGIVDITHVEFGAGFALMFIAPWVHALTYHIFAFGFPRKIALSALSLLYVIVATPLLISVHAWFIHHWSLLTMPLLYLLFGLLLLIAGLVGLYSWAMSWQLRPGDEELYA
jgi:hypothetical protein